MKLNPRTGRSLYEGKAEAAVQRALVEHLGPAGVLYDVGANVGLYTLIGARLVGESGAVVAFEPDPRVVRRLRDNIAGNGFRNVVVIEAAVSLRAGIAQFALADEGVSPELGLGKLSSSQPPRSAVLVQSCKLDDLVASGSVRPPDVIKCDVEGAEVDVFRGASNLISNHHPTVICEVHSARSREELGALLTDLGYRLRWIDECHFLATP